jgi:hypothetical protein
LPFGGQLKGGFGTPRQGVTRLVIAGDLFEDGRDQRDEVLRELLAWLEASGVELVAVVPGNHDRLGERVEIDGWTMPLFPEEFDLVGWHVAHGDGVLPARRVVQGHEHPWLRWRRGVEGPVYFVASEVNEMAAVFGGGSHYLGVFDGSGHSSLGSSDAWGDPSKFFPEAIRLAAERFGILIEDGHA